MLCPICSGDSARRFAKGDWWVRRCRTCGHEFAEVSAGQDHVASVYADTYFNGGEAGYPDYLAEGQLLRRHGRRYGRLLAGRLPTGTVLDVGAAAGFILRGLADYGWRGTGIEPNTAMARYATTHLGMNVQAGALEDYAPAERFDLVTMIQVLPHFYDVRRALRVAADATRPGGHWLIETWDRESWPARLLGPQWHEYSPPSVLHWFSKNGVACLAGQYGFVEVARGRPAKALRSAHAKSLLDYKLHETPVGPPATAALRLVPDDLALPYPTFDLFWMLLRKA